MVFYIILSIDKQFFEDITNFLSLFPVQMMMMEQEQHQEQSGSLNFVPESNIATSISQDGQNSNQNQTQTQTPIPSTAVGLILLKNGSLFSFGLLPPSVEARATPRK